MFDLSLIRSMSSNPLQNYIVPGLKSSLIGAGGKGKGCVRLFESEREQQADITPHSHRFDFQCLVLRGEACNRVWYRTTENFGDEFQVSTLKYLGDQGQYEKQAEVFEYYQYVDTVYKSGDHYSMKADQIHSIFFGKGAVVLFFEGPSISDRSVILEPVVGGVAVPTFKTEDWMFQKG